MGTGTTLAVDKYPRIYGYFLQCMRVYRDEMRSGRVQSDWRSSHLLTVTHNVATPPAAAAAGGAGRPVRWREEEREREMVNW